MALNSNRWWARARGRHRRRTASDAELPHLTADAAVANGSGPPPSSGGSGAPEERYDADAEYPVFVRAPVDEEYAASSPFPPVAPPPEPEVTAPGPPTEARAAPARAAPEGAAPERATPEGARIEPVADQTGDSSDKHDETVRTGVEVMNLEASLKEAMNIEGAIGVALIDYNSGMPLGTLTSVSDLDLDIIAAGTTDFVRAKMRTLELMRLEEPIEDILVTLVTQYHVIRPVTSRSGKGLFMYLMLDKSRANLALARHKLTRIERELEV
ncbi:hypothetical protein GCM10009539_09140 [Cryptosporangium japonicum]|uniref:Roadblock/LAMTOR2 domain-containing protein n=2 Tax=Cryptosporangium japonicum TaxID=80872 RepID=A0ABP3DB59_9ACTN